MLNRVWATLGVSVDSEAWYPLELGFTDTDMPEWRSIIQEEANEEHFEEVVGRTVVRRKDQLCYKREGGGGPLT